MESKQTNELKSKIYNSLESKNLHDAFSLIKAFAANVSDSPAARDVEKLEQSYRYMLQYFQQGFPDPNRNTMLGDIITSLYSITDSLAISLESKRSFDLFYSLHSKYIGDADSLSSCMSAYRAKLAMLALLKENPEASTVDYMVECENYEKVMFNIIWTSFPISSADVTLLRDAFADESVPVHFKCLVTSALMIGLICYYDEPKLILLLELYSLCLDNAELQVRIMASAVIAMYVQRTRVAHSKKVEMVIDGVATDSNFRNDLAAIFLRLVSARNTEKLSKKLDDDIMPNLMKVAPDLIKRFKKGGDAPLDVSDFDGNPEWKDVLDKSGFTKKMEEMSKIQMEGGDVFMGTFSHLKTFPFFHEICNWFMPYHSEHSVVMRTFGTRGVDATMNNFIKSAPFLCNSDKYSFCLSFGSVPADRRGFLTEQMGAQQADMQMMQGSSLPSTPTETRDSIANKYIQDLYRFFHLFSRRREFVDVFDSSLNLLEVPFLAAYFNVEETVGLVAETYFKNGFYDDAISFFKHLLVISENAQPSVMQKLAFSYQKKENYKEALGYYHKYELVNSNDLWTLRQIATCYRALKQMDKAVDYLQRAELLDSDSVAISLALGHCLLALGKVDEALKSYYKVDYLDVSGTKALRPIAWCSFLLGHFDQSRKYYEKLEKSGAMVSQDYLNYGHLELAVGNVKQAVVRYRKACQSENGKKESFRAMFLPDCESLEKVGVDKSIFSLVIDSVAYDEM